MPFIRVPKLSGSHPLELATAVQVRLIWTMNDADCINVLGGQVGGDFVNSQAHADALSTAVSAVYTSSGLRALHASTTVFNGVGIRDVRIRNLAEYVSYDGTEAGTGSGDPMPAQTAAVMTLRTAFAGKSYRGRVYIGGANEAQNTSSGRIDGTYRTTAIAFLEAVRDAMADEGITLAVLSAPRYANLTPPLDVQTWPGAITPVLAGGISSRDNAWNSQRRRRS